MYGMPKSNDNRETFSNNTYIKKEERSQINNLILHLKKIENKEQTKPKVSKRKEIKRD